MLHVGMLLHVAVAIVSNAILILILMSHVTCHMMSPVTDAIHLQCIGTTGAVAPKNKGFLSSPTPTSHSPPQTRLHRACLAQQGYRPRTPKRKRREGAFDSLCAFDHPRLAVTQ
jgi:hypothetical protein